jgi:hypothetical protein
MSLIVLYRNQQVLRGLIQESKVLVTPTENENAPGQ